MPLFSVGITDVGRTRLTNQDAIYLNPAKRIFVVADGMGGHSGGDIASNLAVKHIPQYIEDNPNEDPVTSIVRSVKHAHNTIKKMSEDNNKLQGMGTTVISFMFRESTLYIGNVGDSRGYLINKKKAFQLTRDHSLIQEKINLGIYTRQEALEDPQKNILIRAVGFEQQVKIDVFTYKVLKNDIFLLCSDGLYNKVSEKDMVEIINNFIPDPTTAKSAELNLAVNALIGLANINGGQDNISIIMILVR